MYVFGNYYINYVLKARLDIVQLDIWIVIVHYLIEGNTVSDQFKDIYDRDSCACNTRFSEMNAFINYNSICH